MTKSEKVVRLQWIFTRLILWYKNQDKATRKEFDDLLDKWLDRRKGDVLYASDPRNKSYGSIASSNQKIR